jgi:hypothetical protein
LKILGSSLDRPMGESASRPLCGVWLSDDKQLGY